MICDLEILNLLLDSICQFVCESLVFYEQEVVEIDCIFEVIIVCMCEMGLFGLLILEVYGGFGVIMEEEVSIVFELGWILLVFCLLLGINNGIGFQGIVIDGIEEQKWCYLLCLVLGELFSLFCFIELDFGFDVVLLKIMVVCDGEYYVFNGIKCFIINVLQVGIYIVMVCIDLVICGVGGIFVFVVECGMFGLFLGKLDCKMGQKGVYICDVIFDDCWVFVSQLIGGVEGVGFKIVMKVFDKGCLYIVVVCVGVVEWMFEDVLCYVLECKQFGQLIVEFQLIQVMFVDSKVEVYVVCCMVIDVVWQCDEGCDVGIEVFCVKLFVLEMCGCVVDCVVQIFGGVGYIGDYGIECFYCDVWLFCIYEGIMQIQ